jgi:hypothetical protein
MTVTLTYTNLKNFAILDPKELSKGSSEWKFGRLPVSQLLKNMRADDKIDVIALKGELSADELKSLSYDRTITINETRLRNGKRKTIKFSDLSKNCFAKGRLDLGTAYMKGIKTGETREPINYECFDRWEAARKWSQLGTRDGVSGTKLSQSMFKALQKKWKDGFFIHGWKEGNKSQEHDAYLTPDDTKCIQETNGYRKDTILVLLH